MRCFLYFAIALVVVCYSAASGAAVPKNDLFDSFPSIASHSPSGILFDPPAAVPIRTKDDVFSNRPLPAPESTYPMFGERKQLVQEPPYPPFMDVGHGKFPVLSGDLID